MPLSQSRIIKFVVKFDLFLSKIVPIFLSPGGWPHPACPVIGKAGRASILVLSVLRSKGHNSVHVCQRCWLHLSLNKADHKSSLVFVFALNHPPQVVYVDVLVSLSKPGAPHIQLHCIVLHGIVLHLIICYRIAWYCKDYTVLCS